MAQRQQAGNLAYTPPKRAASEPSRDEKAKLLRATLLGKGSDTGNARSLPTPGGALSQSVSGAHGTAQGSIRAALAWEEDDEALLAAIPTDTELAVIALTGQFHASLSAANLPMLALRSHLYIQWGRTDRTELDRELDDLRRTNTLRVFQLTLGADDIGIMQTALYAQRVRTAAAEAGVQASDTSYSSGPTGPSASTPHKLQKPCPYQTAATIFIDHVLPQHTETFVPDQQLLQTISKHLDNPLGSQQPCTPNPTSPRIQMNKPSPAASAAADRVLTRLLNIGCLARSPHHLDGYVFCVPGIGPLLRHIPSGRKELLGWLSKRRYKEAGEALLLKTKMRGAGPLPLRYLLLDLLGKGDLVRLETPGGACIRLAHR